MNTQQLAAILLIVGFALTIVSMVLIPPGLYDTVDPQARVQIIEDYESSWRLGQIVVSLAVSLIAASFVALAWQWRSADKAWIPGLGAAAFVVGTLIGLYFVYLQTTDPLGGYGGVYTTFEYLYYWLALAGLLLFGITFLQVGLPAWIGYVTAGIALVYGIFFLVTGAGFMTPFLIALLSPVIAIVLLRHNLPPALQAVTEF